MGKLKQTFLANFRKYIICKTNLSTSDSDVQLNTGSKFCENSVKNCEQKIQVQTELCDDSNVTLNDTENVQIELPDLIKCNKKISINVDAKRYSEGENDELKMKNIIKLNDLEIDFCPNKEIISYSVQQTNTKPSKTPQKNHLFVSEILRNEALLRQIRQGISLETTNDNDIETQDESNRNDGKNPDEMKTENEDYLGSVLLEEIDLRSDEPLSKRISIEPYISPDSSYDSSSSQHSVKSIQHVMTEMPSTVENVTAQPTFEFQPNVIFGILKRKKITDWMNTHPKVSFVQFPDNESECSSKSAKDISIRSSQTVVDRENLTESEDKIQLENDKTETEENIQMENDKTDSENNIQSENDKSSFTRRNIVSEKFLVNSNNLEIENNNLTESDNFQLENDTESEENIELENDQGFIFEIQPSFTRRNILSGKFLANSDSLDNIKNNNLTQSENDIPLESLENFQKSRFAQSSSIPNEMFLVNTNDLSQLYITNNSTENVTKENIKLSTFKNTKDSSTVSLTTESISTIDTNEESDTATSSMENLPESKNNSQFDAAYNTRLLNLDQVSTGTALKSVTTSSENSSECKNDLIKPDSANKSFATYSKDIVESRLPNEEIILTNTIPNKFEKNTNIVEKTEARQCPCTRKSCAAKSGQSKEKLKSDTATVSPNITQFPEDTKNSSASTKYQTLTNSDKIVNAVQTAHVVNLSETDELIWRTAGTSKSSTYSKGSQNQFDNASSSKTAPDDDADLEIRNIDTISNAGGTLTIVDLTNNENEIQIACDINNQQETQPLLIAITQAEFVRENNPVEGGLSLASGERIETAGFDTMRIRNIQTSLQQDRHDINVMGLVYPVIAETIGSYQTPADEVNDAELIVNPNELIQALEDLVTQQDASGDK